jgi:hypothetical protein
MPACRAPMLKLRRKRKCNEDMASSCVPEKSGQAVSMTQCVQHDNTFIITKIELISKTVELKHNPNSHSMNLLLN